MSIPVLDQYFPGGVAQQSLQWNDQAHQSMGGGGQVGATGAGPDGPTGHLTLGNVTFNWGTVDATNQGVTVSFSQPYIDGPPAIVIGSNSSNAAK